MKPKARPDGPPVKIPNLIDAAKCFQTVRNIRSPATVSAVQNAPAPRSLDTDMTRLNPIDRDITAKAAAPASTISREPSLKATISLYEPG